MSHVHEDDIGVVDVLYDFTGRSVFQLITGETEAELPAFFFFPTEVWFDEVGDFEREDSGHSSLSNR
jgi:hypothetical protein